jgi:hypothetical protein
MEQITEALTNHVSETVDRTGISLPDETDD